MTARKRKATDKSAAVVTIIDAAKMTPKGRKAVAAWLRRTGDALVRGGELYVSKFRARYLYRD